MLWLLNNYFSGLCSGVTRVSNHGNKVTISLTIGNASMIIVELKMGTSVSNGNLSTQMMPCALCA